jgi:hypothetical protein
MELISLPERHKTLLILDLEMYAIIFGQALKPFRYISSLSTKEITN